jgi:signal transduction histidine kinase
LNIRKQLLILSAGSAVPLVLVGAVALNSLWRASKTELGKSLEQRAQLASVALERWIDAQRQPLNTIAAYRAARLELPSEYFRVMVATRPHWIDLRVFDGDTRELSTWPAGAGKLPEELQASLFADLRRTKSWEITTDWMTRAANEPTLIFAMPVEADGGAVIMRAHASAMKEVFRDVELPDGAGLSVFDQQGRVLYHSAEEQELVGTDITSSPLFSALGERRTALLEADSPYDGVRRVYGLARAGATGCIVKIDVSNDALYRLAWGQFARYLAYSALALVCALIAALFMARRISRPIQGLRNMAHRVGAGGANVRTDGHGGGEIAELGEAFNLMAARIEEREENLRILNKRLSELNELKSEIVSGVSHELRTPLTTIKTLSRLMLRDELNEAERRESLEVIALECDRQIDLVLNLLDLSRIEAGAFHHQFTRVDMVELLHVCARVERHAAGLRGHEFIVDVPSRLPDARTDRKAVRRVLCSVIENAIKYTPEGGRITLSARADGDGVCVDISDTGPGIPETHYPYVFDKFWRGGRHAAKTANVAARPFSDGAGPDEGRMRDSGAEVDDLTPDAPGVGLGLYLARTILEQLGGRIEFVSAVGRGSTFTVRLPAWREGFDTEDGEEKQQHVTSLAGRG